MSDKLILNRSHLHTLYRQMLRIRRFESRCVELYQAQKIRGFMHLYDGEEAVAVGVMSALEPQDAVVATYREHGHALARGGSMHLFDRSRRFYGGNAIVGGGIPLAAGIALADQRLRAGAVTACFFGEGASGEGVFHEVMNMAKLWHLPVLFICENNLYAMGVPLTDADVETDVWRKACAYRMPAEQIDGMDPVQVEVAAHRAVAHIRSGDGPYFLEARTYRFRAHSMFDSQAYRQRDEIEHWKLRDPIPRLLQWMQANHLCSDDEARAMEADIDAEIQAAVDFAENGSYEPVDDLERFVLMSGVVQECTS
jgi:pyruvate dehydrogenase E1 component alpha subunit